MTVVSFAFRYLQADAHRQETRAVGQLDGGARDAVAGAANGEPGAESRAVYIASRGTAGHAEQHREASTITCI